MSAFNLVKVTLLLCGNEMQAFQINLLLQLQKSKSLQHALKHG